MCGRTETAKFSSGPLLLEIHPPFVFRFTDARPDSARQSRRATYTSHIVHTHSHTHTHTGAMPSLAFFLLPNTYEMNPQL